MKRWNGTQTVEIMYLHRQLERKDEEIAKLREELAGLKQMEKKVLHGCWDAYCKECDDHAAPIDEDIPL